MPNNPSMKKKHDDQQYNNFRINITEKDCDDFMNWWNDMVEESLTDTEPTYAEWKMVDCVNEGKRRKKITYKCSICGYTHTVSDLVYRYEYDYCPNCGSIMI